MFPCKVSLVTFLILFESLFCKIGLFHGNHGPPKLIIISLDGFRWDYLDLVKKANLTTPNFDELLKRGSSISNDGVKNVFITKTLPNHYSLATGFYEESHGVVANSFYDPAFNETFNMSLPSATEQKWWDGKSGKIVEPIWLTNEKSNRRSGVVFWPGCNVENQVPAHMIKYNTSISFESRVDTLVGWFNELERPINFGMMYIEEPDRTGHKYGPESKEVVEKVIELDKVLGYLIGKLNGSKLFHSTNIIITSDHGMIGQKDIIYLSDFVSNNSYQAFGGSPALNLLPRSGLEDEIYNKLKNVSNLLVYKKNEIPKDYHYQNNRRIQPLVVSAKEGFMICLDRSFTWCRNVKGDHGYNNSLKSMHPIFIAAGPAFRTNFLLDETFEIVDIYSLMCSVLGLEPHENEGDFSRVSNLLKSNERNLGEDITFISILIIVLAVALIFIVGLCYHHYQYFVMKNGDSSKSLKEGQKHLLASEEDDELV